MEIEIKNYNCINELKYNIVDKKINFLIGISGSGKSSIANALTNLDFAYHFPLNDKSKVPYIAVNQQKYKTVIFKTFNLEYVNDVLITRSNSADIYEMIYDNNNKLIKYRENYENTIQDLKKISSKIKDIIITTNSLIFELKLKTIHHNKALATQCLPNLLLKNINECSKLNKSMNYSTKEMKWIHDGLLMKSISNNICPFCETTLSSKKLEKIKSISRFDAKTFEKITLQANSLSNLGIKLPNWNSKKEVKLFNKQLIDYYIIHKNLTFFNNYIDATEKSDLENFSLETHKPNKIIQKYYPEIYDSLLLFNKKISLIKKELGILKKRTNQLISKNIYFINEQFNKLGIPYEFIKKEANDSNKTATYCISFLKDSEKNIDRKECLSFGERNIVSILFFLLSNKDKNLILDDPISSFDDYRRKAIFDIIYELQNNNTILILSHDFLFAKYAIFHYHDAKKLLKNNSSISILKKKFYNNTGNIDFFENYISPKVIPIKYDDFNSITFFAAERLKQLKNEINYQTAINLRIYFELTQNIKQRNIIYQYLSSILHKTDYNKILIQLKCKNYDENQVLKLINKYISIKFSNLSPNYIADIDKYHYTDFEKIIKCREELRSRSSKIKVLKDELNNIIHMNSLEAICLNPYKFNYFSKFVKNKISK